MALGTLLAAAAVAAVIVLDRGTWSEGGPEWPFEAAGAGAADVQSAASAYGWGEPEWADEFAGTRPDPAWALYDSPGHAGNGSRRPSQVTLADGALTQAGTADALSAGMVRVGADARYGRWEVRLRADGRGAGSRPYHAVLALIPGGPYVDGERDVDFAEADIGTGKVNLFVHYRPYKQDFLALPLDLAAWHTFAVEITPEHVIWFVDGEVRATVTRAEAIPETPLALNLQLDAYQPGDLAPGRLQLDWARFYPLPEDDLPTLPGPVPAQGVYDPSR